MMTLLEEAAVKHFDGCHLSSSGHVWRECVCAQIHADDRPCLSCDGLEASAIKCRGCALILEHRRRS